MASSSASAPTAQGFDIAALKTVIYDACVPFTEDDPKIVFHQPFIFDLNLIPNNDVNILLLVTQTLVDEKLFKIVHDTEGMGWRLRSAEDAKKSVLPTLADHN